MEEETGNVRRTQGMLVEKAFNASYNGICLGVPREALCERCVTDIFSLDKGKNNEREEFDLVLPVLGKVAGKLQTERSEFSV